MIPVPIFVITPNRPLTDIARDHANSRTLSTTTRAVFAALADGGTAEIAATQEAFFEAALSCATRKGQSMARRVMTADLTMLRNSLQDNGDHYTLPLPRSYTTGAPVGITVHDDGRVEVVTYLGEVASAIADGEDIDPDDTDAPSDDQRIRDSIAIEAAIQRGTITHTTSKGA